MTILLTAWCASQCTAQDPSGPGLLGLASREQRPAAVRPAGPPPASRWQRLPADAQADLFRVLRRQLEQPARSEEKLPHKTPVAASNATGAAYQAWRALGDRDPAWANPDTWPIYLFDHGLGEDGRRILLSLYAKLRSEGLWDRIETFDRFSPQPTWPGFWIIPLDPEDFRMRLSAMGYGEDQVRTRGSRWAVRAPKPGAQFHVIGPHPDGDPRFVEVHIDLSSPGVMRVEPTLGSVISAPVRELCYAWRAGAHWATDVKLWGNDAYGGREERMADRLQSLIVAQGIAVLDVDEQTHGTLTLSNMLKWRTRSSCFGYLWLRPADRRAGWWTDADGARDFDRVEYLENPGTPASTPRFVLTYAGGWVEVTIRPDGGLHGRWFRGSGLDGAGRATHADFDADLVLGRVR